MAISKDRYSTAAIGLHWLIACVDRNIGIAWYFNTLKGRRGPPSTAPFDRHHRAVVSLGRLACGWPRRRGDAASLTVWERG